MSVRRESSGARPRRWLALITLAVFSLHMWFDLPLVHVVQARFPDIANELEKSNYLMFH